MCGIIAYNGKNNAIDILKTGLKNLEYRGYDSAGISFFEQDRLNTIKKEGTVNNLFKHVPNDINSAIGIGHTRWATHGKANDTNSHPHSSQQQLVSLVHNGIIENYLNIKNDILKNAQFKSETDTEVIANLIEYYYLKVNDKLKSISLAIKHLKGSYALAILFKDDNKCIYFAKSISPMVIGTDDFGNYISSDILGFSNYTKKYVEIENNWLGYITNNEINIFDFNLTRQKVNIKTIVTNDLIVSRNGYPHYMIKEINEIANTIENTANLYATSNSPLNAIPKKYFKDIKKVKLIACGTSYHASLYGAKLLCKIGIDASAEIASEFIYEKKPIDKHTLCMFISQSGETADTLCAVKLAKNYGAKTVAITNVQTSSITKVCDYVLPIKCGAEIAVASTKAYNGQLCALQIFADYLENNYNNSLETLDILSKIGNNIDIKELENQVQPLINEVKTAKNLFIVGKNFDYITSMEASLKIKEISYINCQAYASGELKHGTISLIDETALVFAFITEPELIDKTLNIVRQTQSRGAKICVVTPFESVLKDESINYFIKLPSLDSALYPTISIIPMQLLAYYVSVSFGYNPDQPRFLAKSVTVE